MKLQAFKLTDLQVALHILLQAEISGIDSITVLRNKVASAIHTETAKHKLGAIRRDRSLRKLNRCPSCGKGPYITLPVNDSPATHVGGQWKAMKLCRNCYHEEWIKK